MTTQDTLLPDLPAWPASSSSIVYVSAHQWAQLGLALAQLNTGMQIIANLLSQQMVASAPFALATSKLAASVASMEKNFMGMPKTLADIQQDLTDAADQAEATAAEHAVQVKASTDATDALIVLFKQHQSGLDPTVAAAFEAQIARVAATTAALATHTTELAAQVIETEAADDEEENPVETSPETTP